MALSEENIGIISEELSKESKEDGDTLFLDQVVSLPPEGFDNDARDQFSRDTAVLLLGLGLESQEIELFQKHQVGLEKFIKLTSSDLEYIGITSPKKKQHVVACINKFRRQREQQPEEITKEENVLKEFNIEDCRALVNVEKHLHTLVKSLPYVQRRMKEVTGCHFFRSGLSAQRTLEFVLERCIQQSIQTRQQLQAYVYELEKGQSWEKRNNQKQRKKLLALVLAGVGFAIIAAHHIRSPYTVLRIFSSN